ncbi:chemotaxis response regulator CheY [soil metagenome]
MSSKTVLIVDDMRTVRLKLRKICTDVGVKTIFEAADGAEAFEVLMNFNIDLVLSDWNMPILTGIELVKKMRETPKIAAVPVIFITSETEKSAILQSLQYGITDYVVKPFLDATVSEKVVAILNAPPVRA